MDQAGKPSAARVPLFVATSTEVEVGSVHLGPCRMHDEISNKITDTDNPKHLTLSCVSLFHTLPKLHHVLPVFRQDHDKSSSHTTRIGRPQARMGAPSPLTILRTVPVWGTTPLQACPAYRFMGLHLDLYSM